MKNVKKPDITKKTKFKQGKYKPLNPKKYIGNPSNITFRSSWEYDLMNWLDRHPAVRRWASEEVIIPYLSPVDGKQHRYYVDFYAEIFTRNQILEKYLIEVKPYAQTVFPKMKKKSGVLTESSKEDMRTFLVNSAKWKAASRFAQKRGMKFIIITENELFGKNGNSRCQKKVS